MPTLLVRRLPVSKPSVRVPHDELPRLLARAWAAFHPVLLRHLAEEGLDGVLQPGMGHILLALYAKDGCRIGDLARRAGISHVAVLQIAGRLEKAGLVDRRSCARDGRATRLWLTRRARAIEPRVRAVHQRNLASLSEMLGPPAAAQLTRLLRRLAKELARQ